jgi:hypothetical protein
VLSFTGSLCWRSRPAQRCFTSVTFNIAEVAKHRGFWSKQIGLPGIIQWLKAEPVYRQPERLYRQKNDSSRALYAHVSQIIPHAESRSLPGTILELTDDLKLPAARKIPRRG